MTMPSISTLPTNLNRNGMNAPNLTAFAVHTLYHACLPSRDDDDHEDVILRDETHTFDQVALAYYDQHIRTLVDELCAEFHQQDGTILEHAIHDGDGQNWTTFETGLHEGLVALGLVSGHMVVCEDNQHRYKVIRRD